MCSYCVHESTGITLKVHNVELEQEKVYPAVNVRVYMNSKLKELKELIGEVQ